MSGQGQGRTAPPRARWLTKGRSGRLPIQSIAGVHCAGAQPAISAL